MSPFEQSTLLGALASEEVRRGNEVGCSWGRALWKKQKQMLSLVLNGPEGKIFFSEERTFGCDAQVCMGVGGGNSVATNTVINECEWQLKLSTRAGCDRSKLPKSVFSKTCQPQCPILEKWYKKVC